MSSDIAVRVEQLSKCYEIYAQPRDRLLQMLFRGRKQFFREFWALRDVSFEIRRGETVGIVGRNGSGKSTLLQLLCGTLYPTFGRVAIQGKVAALLELGAGFNPEFTGRENIFLCASLYGLSKEQIEERFDQIAAFADIGNFIDQSVKTYSSGMFVRLAFAVQVHLDPEIFVIDEALAVGDQRFVQKCYRKLEALKEGGTSLLFVSHDTTAVKMLCDRAMWIHDGRLREIGDASRAVDCYRNWADGVSDVAQANVNSDFASIGARIAVDLVKLKSMHGAESSSFMHGETVSLEVLIRNLTVVPSSLMRFGFSIRNNRGVEICSSNTQDYEANFLAPDVGSSLLLEARFELPLLAAGQYALSLSVDSLGPEGEYLSEVLLADRLVIHIDEKTKVYTIIGLQVEFSVAACEAQVEAST